MAATTAGPLVVLYTDPPWARDDAGRLDPSKADIERGIFGAGFELCFGNPPCHARGTARDDGLEELLPRADAVVVYRLALDERVVRLLKPRCRVIGRQGVGLDNLNVPLLQKHGLWAFNVPDYCVEEVSTHTLALLLALERQVCIQDRLVKDDRWDIFAGGYPRRLSRLTAGIVGFGRIGRATSRKLQAFYGAVAAYDPNVHSDLIEGFGVTACSSLGDLLARSDAIVLHASLDDGSRSMINRETLGAVKPRALLVNTARGQLVDSAAVREALASGRLGGYAADVFSPEDPNRNAENRRLLTFENVVVSSHRAFLSSESHVSARRRVAEEVRFVLTSGRAPRSGRVS